MAHEVEQFQAAPLGIDHLGVDPQLIGEIGAARVASEFLNVLGRPVDLVIAVERALPYKRVAVTPDRGSNLRQRQFRVVLHAPEHAVPLPDLRRLDRRVIVSGQGQGP